MGLADGWITRGKPWLTYANIAVFHPNLFANLAPDAPLRLFPWMYAFAQAGRVSGEVYHGAWDNVGTEEQLLALDRRLSR
jgi:MurNAc alpha-1-phosphate uridylyltransferase